MNESRFILWFPSDFGGCGHLRSLWINEALNSYYGSKKLYEGITTSRFIVDQNVLKLPKAFHFQRQISDQQLDYMKFVVNFRDKNLKDAPVIYDCDDKFSEIPDFNYAKRFFGAPNIMRNFKQICDMVDIITVTTEDLADWVKSYKGRAKVKIVPNYVPKYIYKPYDFIKKKNDKPRIVWAGSANHFSEDNMGDFGVIYDLIVNTVNEFDWVFMGLRHVPKWISHIGNKITIVPWNPIVGFPTTLKGLNADFGVAPLINDVFNEAKSNIKLLDYWSADLITITSKLKPYVKENEFFFSGDWQKDRDLILNIFNDEEQKKNIIKRQNDKLNKYWLENNLNIYMDLFNLNY